MTYQKHDPTRHACSKARCPGDLVKCSQRPYPVPTSKPWSITLVGSNAPKDAAVQLSIAVVRAPKALLARAAPPVDDKVVPLHLKRAEIERLFFQRRTGVFDLFQSLAIRPVDIARGASPRGDRERAVFAVIGQWHSEWSDDRNLPDLSLIHI